MSPLVEIHTPSRIHSASIDRDGEGHCLIFAEEGKAGAERNDG